MIVIHILALMIGALPIYLTLTGKITGGSYNRETGVSYEGGWPTVLPLILGAIVAASAGGSILERIM